MSWAEVKRINNDLSTPLDTLLLSLRQFIPSDNTLVTFISSSTSNVLGVIGSFIPSINGTVRIYGKIGKGSTSVPTGALIIKENGSEIIREKIGLGSDSETRIDFKVKRNANYQILCDRFNPEDTSPYGYEAQNVSLCADVSDVGLKEYTVYGG